MKKIHVGTAAIIQTTVLGLLLCCVGLTSLAEPPETRRVLIKDCGSEDNKWRGQVSAPQHVLRKILPIDIDPADVRAAKLLYRIATDPYYVPTKSYFRGMFEGVKWDNLLLVVNGKEVLRAPLGEAAIKGWHEVSVPPEVLKQGDNVILFKHDGSGKGSYYYPARNKDTRGHSARSEDYGNSNTFKTTGGEYIVYLRLEVATPPAQRSAFEMRGDHAYGWVEVENFFDRERPSPDGWKSIAYKGFNDPSRGLVAWNGDDRNTMTLPFDLPGEGTWYVWVRGWQDGFRNGRFELAWNGKKFFDSKGHLWSGDVDLRFDWLKCGGVELAKGKSVLTAANFGKCGHMYDVVVLTTDADFVPDEKAPLAAMAVEKQVIPKGFSRPTPGPFMTEDPVLWAKPTAGGPVRTLWACGEINELEIVELARRMDLDYDVLSSATIPFGQIGNYNVVGQDLMMDQADMLYQALSEKDYDVLILVRVNLDQVPDELQKLIVSRVDEGLGLVRVSSQREKKTDHAISVLFDEMKPLEVEHLRSALGPPGTRFPSATYRAYGNGRVVLLSYMNWGTVSKMSAPVPYYPVGEPWFARWAKWLVVAAGRTDNAPGIAAFTAEAERYGRTATVSVTCRNAVPGLRVDAACHGPWAAEQTKASVQVINGKADLTIPLGRENGIYRLDLALKNAEGQVLDFASEDLTVRGTMEIEKLELPADRVEPGSEIPVIVRVAGSPQRPERATLAIELVGAHGRLLGTAREEFSLSAKETDVSLLLPSLPTKDWWAKVRVQLSDANGATLDRRQRSILIKQPPVFDDYRSGSGVWVSLELPDYVRHVPVMVWETLGMNAVVGSAEAALAPPVPRGLRYFHVFRITTAGNPGWGPGRARVPCVHDPAFLGKIWKDLKAQVGHHRQFSSLTVGFGDETFGGVCFSEHTQRAFRRQMKNTYGDITRLNRVWQTDFQDFDTVVPWNFKQAVKRPDNIAPYVEYSLFNAREWANFVAEFVKRSRQWAPDIVAGGLNPFAPTSALKRATNFFPLIYPAVDYASVYPRHFDRARCFITNMRTTSTWTGYDRSRGQMEDEVWRHITYGGTLVGWFGVSRAWYENLSPTFEITERSRHIKAINEGLIDGTAKLVIQGEVAPAPVAIVLSANSLFAYPVKGVAASPDANPSALNRMYDVYRAGYVRLLDPAHIQYDYVTDEQVAQGLPENYRVVIFPRAIALSDACVNATQAFAQRGGVVADEEFGIYNEVGVRRDERPALSGKNVALSGAGEDNALARALVAGGVRSPETFTGTVSRVVRKNIGKGRLTVAFGSGDVSITFPDKAHTYDIREHSYLGEIDTVNLSRKFGPFAVMRLPYKTAGLKLDAPRQSRLGHEVKFSVQVQAEEGTAGVHVVRVDVFGPDDKPRPLYARNVLCSAGRGTAGFWLAWNDDPGLWRIAARDVTSGLRSERELTVRK